MAQTQMDEEGIRFSVYLEPVDLAEAVAKYRMFRTVWIVRSPTSSCPHGQVTLALRGCLHEDEFLLSGHEIMARMNAMDDKGLGLEGVLSLLDATESILDSDWERTEWKTLLTDVELVDEFGCRYVLALQRDGCRRAWLPFPLPLGEIYDASDLAVRVVS